MVIACEFSILSIYLCIKLIEIAHLTESEGAKFIKYWMNKKLPLF